MDWAYEIIHTLYSTDDLEWISKISNDMERRAASLRQLNFLLSATSVPYDHIFAARRVCIARTMPWQDVCPSVRLSVTRRYSVETAKYIPQTFSPYRSHTILVFFVPNGITILRRGTPNGGVEYKGVWKITIFDQYLCLRRLPAHRTDAVLEVHVPHPLRS